MCEVLGIEQNFWSLTGLATDFLGVTLLGFDLVRLQRLLRMQAAENLDHLEDMASEYGGIESWSDNIREQAEWVPESVYSRHHLEDEVSYNARRASSNISDVANCVTGLAEHISKLMVLINSQAQRDATTARKSVRLSILGLMTIAIGFGLQIVGVWFC